MPVRLYVVTDHKNATNYLVCAKTKGAAINYVAKKVVTDLSARQASFMQFIQSAKDGAAIIGAPDDLVAIGIGSA